jgi:DNA (cytosine-5)-methyltransferase 1
MRATPTVISLFSGAGGLDIGLERAGWKIVSATDIDEDAISALNQAQEARLPVRGRENIAHLEGTEIVAGDIRDLHRSDLVPPGTKRDWRPSLLAGGPPCQPWSSAGLQKGFGDTRGQLVFEMIRLAEALRPRYVFMENVRGLLTADGPGAAYGGALRSMQRSWEEAGFGVRWGLVNSADFGAPQRRVRLIMVGSADRELPSFPSPTHAEHPSLLSKPWISLREFLSGIPSPLPEDVVFPTGDRADQIEALSPGRGIRTGGVVEHQRPGGHWGYRQDSFLSDLDRPARTIRAAATPDWIRPEGQRVRRLTWRECAEIQGFPQAWTFPSSREARFRLIGNAVQADVAQAFGEQLLAALDTTTSSRTVPNSAPWPDYFERRVRGASADHHANRATRKRSRADD